MCEETVFVDFHDVAFQVLKGSMTFRTKRTVGYMFMAFAKSCTM